MNQNSSVLISASKDCTVRLWDVPVNVTIRTLALHTMCVTKVIWTADNYILSASEDRSIRVWNKEGNHVKELKGHSHWVNCMALDTDYSLR